MAGYEDDDAPPPQQVTAARDAYVAGRDLHIHQHVVAAAVAGSWYRETVRDRFWVPLSDRDAELAELAAFCARPEGSDYAWWQADAYAGKTALMAHLVLAPPPKVRIVSFFVTARIAGQDDREAFIDNVLEQLAAWRQQPVPAVTPKTAPAVLAGMIEQTSAWCWDQGERLVLVVDGLDEDTGVSGPQGSSIAALLPRRPPHGMRVIVCSRPSPGVPHDVPPSHPLRDDAIVRPLLPSGDALVIRDQAESELARLLDGARSRREDPPALGRRIVGLLVAARGPLAAADLARLTGTDRYLIERLLSRTVAARSFARVRVRTRPGVPITYAYVLGHQELAATASLILEDELPGHLNDLLAWAGAYRSHWPADTPDYVLAGGFFELLGALGDLGGVTALALDAARHERMYLRTGTDQPGISETARALGRHLDADADLATVGRLALHRDLLWEHNRSMPSTLPAIWAKIGYHDHAFDLARTITHPRERAGVLAEVAEGAASGGDRAMAAQAAAEAEAAADAIDDTEALVRVLTEVARAWVAAGQYTDAAEVTAGAEQHAYRVEAPENRALDLALVAQAWAAAGDAARAAETATEAESAVEDPDRQKSISGSLALALLAEFWAAAGHAEAIRRIATLVAEVINPDVHLKVCQALGKIGDLEHAARIAADIENADNEHAARASLEPMELMFRVWSLVMEARAWAAAGDRTRVAHAVTEAQRIAATIPSAAYRARALTKICQALTESGDTERAAQVVSEADQAARAVDDPAERAKALTEVCRALAEAGDVVHAALVAGDVELAARAVYVPSEWAKELAKVGEVWVTADLAAETERVARTVEEEWRQADAFAEAARMWATVGDVPRATAVLAEAEQAARRIQVAGQRDSTRATIARTLVAVARSWTAAGNETAATSALEQAESIASAGVPSFEFLQPLIEVVQALADLGRAADAERIARAVSADEPWLRFQTLSRAAGGWMATGSIAMALQTAAEAENSAYALGGGVATPVALATVAVGLAGAPDQAPIARLIAEAERTAHSLDGSEQAMMLSGIAQRLAEAGMAADAERVARTIPDAESRTSALTFMVMKLADAGMTADAERVARTIEDHTWQTMALACVLQKLADAGMPEDAARIADAIDSKESRTVALAASARVLAAAGDHAGAGHAAAQTEQAAQTMESPGARASALARAAAAWAAAGDAARAAETAAAAERAAHAVENPVLQPGALAEVAKAWAETGNSAQAAQALLDAERSTPAIDNPYMRVRSLAELIRMWTGIGDDAHASELTATAERDIVAINNPTIRSNALGLVARALVAVGNVPEAERLVTLDEPERQGTALIEVVRELIVTGMTSEAERIARTIQSFYLRPEALARVAGGWAAAGEAARAAQLAMEAECHARVIESPLLRVEPLTEVAAAWASHEAWAAAKDSARSFRTRLAAEAERGTLSIDDDPEGRHMAQVYVAAGLGPSGWPEIAERIARTIDDPVAHATTLIFTARAWAAGGDTAQAARLAAEVEHIIKTAAGDWRLGSVMARVADTWAAAGDARRAADAAAEAGHLARTSDNMEERAAELVAVAKILADAADTCAEVALPDFAHPMAVSAERLLSEALVLADWKISLPGLARLRPDIASVMVDHWIRESNRQAHTSLLDVTEPS